MPSLPFFTKNKNAARLEFFFFKKIENRTAAINSILPKIFRLLYLLFAENEDYIHFFATVQASASHGDEIALDYALVST